MVCATQAEGPQTFRPFLLQIISVSGCYAQMKHTPDLQYETAAALKGHCYVVGVDEVGRGPLAGPVLAAAVRLDPKNIPDGLNDSKKLTQRKREALFDLLYQCADIGVGEASVSEIDKINILRASHLAMCRAIKALPRAADFALVDGNILPTDLPCSGQTIIKGDTLSLSIAAASVVAKVSRDRLMVALAQHHPGYGWEKNMGYPSAAHREALENLGVTPHHRRSFKPVHNILYQEQSVKS